MNPTHSTRFLVALCLGALLDPAVQAENGDIEVPEIVCLHSEGSDHYRALCHLVLAHLASQPELGLSVRAADRVRADRAITGEPLAGSADRAITGEPLAGSMDILDAIASQPAHPLHSFIGFAQGDVAYYFRHGGHELYPTPHHLQKEVVALARTFPEYLHIYAEGPRLPPSSDLADHLRHWQDLSLGPLGSGTLVTALNLLSSLGGSSHQDTSGRSRTHRRSFWNRSASDTEIPVGGMIVAGAGHPEIERRLDAGRGRLISLLPSEARHLKAAYSQVYETKRVHAYQTDSVLLEVPALLVASKTLPTSVVSAIGGFFAQVDAPRGEAYLTTLGKRQLPNTVSPTSARVEQIYQAINSYAAGRDQGLVLSPHRSLLRRRTDRGAVELVVAVLMATLGLAAGHRALAQLGHGKSVLELSPLVTGTMAVTFCVTWLHLCLFAVWRLELARYLRYGTDALSPFVEHSYFELLPMVLHYIASAFSAEKLFPVDRIAQLLWLSIPLLIGVSTLAGVIHVALPPVLTYLRNNIKREDSMRLDDHFVIVNWHDHTEHVIRQLRTQDNMDGRADPNVVILTKSTSDIGLPSLGTHHASNLPEHELFALPPAHTEGAGDTIMKVIGLSGDSKDDIALRLTQPEKARSIIVFPDLSHAEPDSATMVTVLKLQHALGKDSSVQVIVWCEDARNIDVLLDPCFRLTDVCSNEWTWRMICQATRVSHVSNIYRRLLTSSVDTNEFYEYRIPDDCAPLSFLEAQHATLAYNANSCDEIPGFAERRNTILLAGVIRADDSARENILLNPQLQLTVFPGDSLILLTYVFSSAIGTQLATELREVPRTAA